VTGPLELGAEELGLAALLVLGNAALSLAFRLGLARRLLLATVRSVAQLLLLGFALKWIFASGSPTVIVGVMVFMALLAGFEAVRRTSRRVRGLHAVAMGVMLVSSLAITIYGTQFVIGVEPWYEARYLIPILGMILGNTLNGISLGLETVLEGLDRDRDRIEVLLAHGATRAEASREVVRRAARMGMIPVINMLIAAGLISIPGMMTGQMLAGSDPLTAASYQIFILLCIAGGVAIGVGGVVLACPRLVFDERDRLRVERIRTLSG